MSELHIELLFEQEEAWETVVEDEKVMLGVVE